MFRTALMATVTAAAVLTVSANAAPPLLLTKLGTVKTGSFKDADPRNAEINAFDAHGERIYIVNPASGTLDVIDASNPLVPVQLPTAVNLLADCQAALAASCPLTAGLEPNSVAIADRLMAVAVAAAVRTNNGFAMLYRLHGTDAPELWKVVEVGALPDMITFTDDGCTVLTADEGEPNAAYTIDPLGSVTIIDIKALGLRGCAHSNGKGQTKKDKGSTDAVRTVTFEAFNDQVNRATLVQAGVRIFGPNATVAQDLEPEYIATRDGKAFVTLQENNALAIIDIATGEVEQIAALGLKDFSLPDNELDPSDRDAPGGANGGPSVKLGNWPLFGLYQPDAIDAFEVRGQTYLIMANEGDAREYTGSPGYLEALRLSSGSYVLDPAVFPNASALKQTTPTTPLARINVSKASGNLDADAEYERIEIFGGRSVSIRDAAGSLIWDSGEMFERLVEAQSQPAVTLYKTLFNVSNNDSAFDGRSDDKAIEPESVVVGRIRGRLYAFVGLERDSGIVVLDISNPHAPVFETYINNRLFPGACGPDPNATTSLCGDLGPEGLTFVPGHDSPTRRALLIVTHEVSSTTTIWQVE